VMAKRLLDIFGSLVGLFGLTPVFAAIAVWIKLDSPGPVFFRQVRVGQNGKPFRIFKFRTMCVDAEAKGRQITVGEDPRITRSGKILRKYKLDELPQLLNVFRGEMSLVGPRPEVPRYVEFYPEKLRTIILSVAPGITDFASIAYKDENAVLAQAKDPERVYIHEVLPIKLNYYARYVAECSFGVDIKLIMKTLRAVALSKPSASFLCGKK
jgi:lipopolysaccharide/colanic/teichoic acid biosynthesis glycosyltransferase